MQRKLTNLPAHSLRKALTRLPGRGSPAEAATEGGIHP
jgi:hypothetical protein